MDKQILSLKSVTYFFFFFNLDPDYVFLPNGLFYVSKNTNFMLNLNQVTET